MSTTIFVYPATLPTAVPRGARWAATLAARVLQAFARLAAPRPARSRSRSDEAAEVRRYASRVARYDPRYAADLYAAADRHERAGE